MKIAMIRTTLLKGSGQVRVIKEISGRLHEKGHKIFIFSRQIDDQIPFSRKITVFGNKIPFVRGFTFGLKCGLILKDFDIIHTQYHPGIFTGNIAQIFEKIPHIFTFHGFAPIFQWRSAKQQIKMIDHRLGTYLNLRMGVAHILPVSNYLKNELITHYRIPKEKITTIYNGIDLQRFNPKNSGEMIKEKYKIGNNKIVLFLGRLAPYKGIQFLLNAIPMIQKDAPKTKFIIAGSAREDVLNLKRFISRLGIAKSLIFTGFVPEDEIPNLYAASDIFCYPSLWEGFGLTPAEASASGKPVVAFNHCAIPEVIKQKRTGILVPPKDVKELADAVAFLLQNETIAQKMGMEGRKRTESLFTWDKTVEKTIEIYKKYINRN
jgi:glycosyltransferase involved in cell wall biosynthesis